MYSSCMHYNFEGERVCWKVAHEKFITAFWMWLIIVLYESFKKLSIKDEMIFYNNFPGDLDFEFP